MTYLVAGALLSLMGFALWRGRQVAVALAAAECPDCRVPLVRMHGGPDPRGAPSTSAASQAAVDPAGASWDVHACPTCERVVTTVGDVPSPVAQCPTCHHRSLVIYAERVDDDVVVDEWCDLCGRRVRTSLGRPPHGHDGGHDAARIRARGRDEDRPRDDRGAPPRAGGAGTVLPFRKKS